MEHLWLREAETGYDAPNNKHDKGYKYLLSVKKVFIELLRSFVKQDWVDSIDENNVVKVDKSFILPDFKNKEADLVYWVKMNNKDVIFYVLMEMQSKVDFQMPYRLLLYMVEVWRGILKDSDKGWEKRKDYRLPVVVPIVLYNGKNNWTACRSYKECLSGYELFGDSVLDFKYIIIDVNRYDNETLLEMSNLIATVFLVDKKQDVNTLLENLNMAVSVLKKLSPKEFELFKNWFANIIMRGTEPENRDLMNKIIEESKEVETMVYNLELTLKEERLKNREEGKIEGKIEGILELLQELSDSIPEELERTIRVQKSMEILSAWLKLAAKVDSVEEFAKRIKN
jgi:predicted transposase/invertase (TIGR01784 family)